MYRFEFYNNLNKYKDSLSHSDEYGKKHYQKIENYYGPGKTRYFWSKEEWDAYQKEKEAMFKKAKADVAKRDAYNKNMEAAKAQSKEKAAERRKALLEANQNSRESAMKAGQKATMEEQSKRNEFIDSNRKNKESAIKSGVRSIRDEQQKQFDAKVKETDQIIKDLLEHIAKESGYSANEVSNKLQKKLGKDFKVDAETGEISYRLDAEPDLAEKYKDLATKELKVDLVLPLEHDDPDNSIKRKGGTSWRDAEEYNGVKSNIETERREVLDEYNKRSYEKIMKALHEMIQENKNANEIKNMLWESIHEDHILDSIKGKVYDEIYDGIKYYQFKKPTKSNTKTYENSSTTWDNTEKKLFENKLYEDILYEDKI